MASNGKFYEAAILYKKAGDVEKALDCLARNLSYKEYLSLARSTNVSTLDQAKVLEKIALAFETKNQFYNAAEVRKIIDGEVTHPRNKVQIILF